MKTREGARLVLFSFFSLNTCITPVYVVYLMQSGYSASQISILHILKETVALTLEIPTGIVADLFTYKYCLTLSSLFFVLAMLGFVWIDNGVIIGLAFICWGVALSLTSGTEESYLYKLSRSREDYLNTTVQYSLVKKVGWFITKGSGPLIYALSPLACMFTSFLLAVAAQIAAFLLPLEPRVQTGRSQSRPIIAFRRQDVFHLLPYAFLSCAILDVMIYQQTKLIQDGLKIDSMGGVFIIFTLASILGGQLYKNVRSMDYSQLLLISCITMAITLSVMNLRIPLLLLVGIMSLQSLIYGLSRVANSQHINQIYESRAVASSFSVQSFLTSVLKIVFLAAFGLIVDYD